MFQQHWKLFNENMKGYIISSIVKKDFGQVWIESEEERRFILVADRDMKVNVEVILKLCD